jgi:hypothetical protein
MLLAAGVSDIQPRDLLHIKLKFPLCLISYHTMKAYRRMEVRKQLPALVILYPGKEPMKPTGCETGWMPGPLSTWC